MTRFALGAKCGAFGATGFSSAALRRPSSAHRGQREQADAVDRDVQRAVLVSGGVFHGVVGVAAEGGERFGGVFAFLVSAAFDQDGRAGLGVAGGGVFGHGRQGLQIGGDDGSTGGQVLK